MHMVQVAAPLTLGIDGMVKVAMINRWVRQRGASSATLLPTWMPPDESEPGWVRWGDIGIKDTAGTGLADPSELDRLFDAERQRVADLLEGSVSHVRRGLDQVFSRFVARLESLGAGQRGTKEPQEVKRDDELGRLYLELVGPGGIPELVMMRLGQ